MAVGVNIVSEFDAKGIKRAVAEFKKLEGAGAKSTYALRTFDKALSSGIVNVGKYAAGIAAAAGVIGYKLASAAYESQKVMAQTTQIIKATGGAANVTAQQVSNLSEKLSMQIGVDDELIQKSANLLLTFKQVQNQVGANNDIFNRAVTAAQDLGSVFGSADAAAMQLGKALSDPEKGITALRRAGINFTEQQKEQIKTLVASGDVLGAQKLILAEVESQVGGTAAASATGFERMQVALGNVAEEFGAILIPYIERFATFVIDKVVPYLERLAHTMGEQGVGGALKMLATDFMSAIENGGKFTNILLGLVAAFTAIKLVTIAATISQTAFNTALLMNPIGITVAAVIALGVALAALYLKFEGVRKVLDPIGRALVRVFQEIAEKVMNFFIIQINLVIGAINAAIWVANKLGASIEPIGYIALKSFGDTSAAAEQAAVDINKIRAQFQGLKEDRNIEGVYRQVKSVTRVTKETEDTFGGAGRAIETAKQKLQKYVDALKGTRSAQRSYQDAIKGVTKANEDLAAANARAVAAQERFNRVISGFGSNSAEARRQGREVTNAQRALERAGYGVENAMFAVSEAERDLAEIRLDPDASAQAIREAEIALAEAKLQVADATDAQVDATDELASAEARLDEIINGAKEGSQTYKDALDELNEAKRDQVAATDAVTAAYERQRDALDALREAEEKLRELQKTTPDRIERRAANMLNTPLEVVSPSAVNLDAGVFTSPIRNAMLENMPWFAEGGIVRKATAAVVGEAGPEAIIPLDKMNQMGGMNITVNINAGMGTDPAALGDEIVNVLQRYNRRNGALPLKVA